MGLGGRIYMIKYYKFGVFDNEMIETEYYYQNNWTLEQYPNFERIVVAPKNNQIMLIKDIVKDFEPPYYILYVLIVSRCENELGRYQCPYPLNNAEVNDFLDKFKDYFEKDGRHHIWIGSIKTKQLAVYDNHNLIYIYGDVSKNQKKLNDLGFIEGAVKIPAPHSHRYNVENDNYEIEIMNYWEWVKFPLCEQDTP